MENKKLSLKALRVDKGISQTEVAVALGVSRKTVSAWENRKAFPKADKIDGICKVLGVSYDEIKWKA